jgi:hypothetical protein
VREYKSGYTNKTQLTDEDEYDISLKVIAKAIIRDWKGLKQKVDGKFVDLPYSPDAAYNILKDERYIVLTNWIIGLSQTMERFKETVREDDEKKHGS